VQIGRGGKAIGRSVRREEFAGTAVSLSVATIIALLYDNFTVTGNCPLSDMPPPKTTSVDVQPLVRRKVFIYLFIIKSFTKYTTDRHTVRTMKAVKAALNTNTRQNIVYKIM